MTVQEEVAWICAREVHAGWYEEFLLKKSGEVLEQFVQGGGEGLHKKGQMQHGDMPLSDIV